MAYSARFNTKAASDEHDERVKELREIMEGLEDDHTANAYVLKARLARVVELLIQEIA